MNATQLKSGSWRARAYNRYTGKQVSFTAPTKKEAERQANLYSLQETQVAKEDITLGEALELYISSHETVWEKTTLREYKTYISRYYEKYSSYPISKFDSAFCQKIVNEMCEGRDRSTVKTAYGVLSGVLNTYAPDRRIKVTFPKKVKKEIKIPTEEDINKLIEVAKNTNMISAIYCGAFLGLRRGEYVALDLDHINFKTREIYIEYSIAWDGEKFIKKNPKTMESRRKIVAPQIVIDAIKKYGLPSITINRLTSGMPKLCKRAGIPNIKYHALRHYCASKLLSINTPIPDAMRYLGWSNDNTLKQVYMHSLDNSMKASADKWNEATSNMDIAMPDKHDSCLVSCLVTPSKKRSKVRLDEYLF